MPSPAIVWFRDDLRVSDNPALDAAARSGVPLLCVYVLDEESEGLRPLGGASRWWLHGSLDALSHRLQGLGTELAILRGAAAPLLERLAREAGAGALYFNRRYLRAEIAADEAVRARLEAGGAACHGLNGRLLHEPGEILNKAGKPFQIYGPYLRAVLSAGEPEKPLRAPKKLAGAPWPKGMAGERLALAELRLEPGKPDWAGGMRQAWARGEEAGLERLEAFLDRSAHGYATNRNLPAVAGTSRLSPHLRFGEVSPRQIWHAAQGALHRVRRPVPQGDVDKLLGEVIWRDFCYGLIHEHPHLPARHHDRRFDRFPYRDDEGAIAAWRRGRTGYPIVDAGIRQLWETGWMHNRVRMIVASFLAKHLLVDWRVGEAWFWDTLVDADPANNAFSWQWIAGTGPDSAPFHRIFNPVTQGERFDPDGEYVRAFLPELSRLPASVIHKPWKASASILRSAGVALGETYPEPIVDHGEARARALAAMMSLRGKAA